MSHELYYKVGPYAEWLVPVRGDPGYPNGPDGDPLFEHVLYRNFGGADDSSVRIGRVRYRRYCLTPIADRPGGPRYVVWCNSLDFGGYDMTDVNPQAEIEAFAAAFAPELEELTRWFGKPPTLRWGVVKSDT
jgi:hypothetical protein